MTTFDKPVRRVTLGSYRVTISGVLADTNGRRIVAMLHGDHAGDYLSLREHGRRFTVTLNIAELYRRGLIAGMQAAKREKRKAKR